MELVLSIVILKKNNIDKKKLLLCFSFKRMKPEEINQEEDVDENTPLLIE